MTEEELKFAKNVNVDKAKNKTLVSILLIIISLLTYVIPIIEGIFDFGLIFEIVAFVLLLLARNCMEKYDEDKAKRFSIGSMLVVGWMVVYDIIVIFLSIENFEEFIYYCYYVFRADLVLVLFLINQFSVNKDLSKADNPTKYKESTDWFYDKLETKDKEEK